jgi:hypothetical protein
MCLSIALKRPADILATGEHLGFQWKVIHNGMGFRCGYVRIPSGHPWHGKGEESLECSVHGGITFSELDEPCGDPSELAAPSWWIGFDCAHASDAPDPLLPGDRSSFDVVEFLGYKRYVVRTQEYVEVECLSLCEQAAAAAQLATA